LSFLPVFVIIRHLPRSTLFPYTTLFRSDGKYTLEGITGNVKDGFTITNVRTGKTDLKVTKAWKDENESDRPDKVKVELYQNGKQDRKSTRLNSSHVKISYAVFCLKKKNT